ncbi:uncharacterized protein LOC114541333 [Dendronephthya gigantea]|uniref:uncharacterized protein LOC114541333 n=1 Tax=Dendronephthya gigantea TaxID=151771 RepID=UPI00106B7712|nr:uncharacterized protein LOC114541333 [Dendronephthya gigantea]
MPINRVPVVHKFGIISQTQRVDLEKRIAKKAYIETRRKFEAQQRPEQKPLPFEVTEEFVYKFNDSNQEEREKLEDTAMKMLKRLQRLAGLRQAGEADHVDLPRAWVDLALLSQCRSSKLEEACIESLIASLDQAVMNEEQILSLFYLAKSGVHWLKKNTGNSSVLRSNEILLLKMTRLVFIRLYCHYLLDQLQGYEDQQTSLAQYLRGFSEKALAFDQFPGAYLSVRIIDEAGRIICSMIKNSKKEGLSQDESRIDPARKGDPQDATMKMNDSSQMNRESMTKTKFDKVSNHGVSAEEPVSVAEDLKDDETDYDKGISIFLQCTLNVWHVVNHDVSSLSEVLCDLLESATRLLQEEWLEVVLAFYFLADASCKNVRVLKAFQCLMSQEFSPVIIPFEKAPHLCETCYSSLPTSPDKKARNSTAFRDSLLRNERVSDEEQNTRSSLVETLQEFVGLDLTQEQFTTENIESYKTHDSALYSRHRGSAGKDIPVSSFTMATRPKRRHGWPWELVYTFCECLTTVCLNGKCAEVQKISIVGTEERNRREVKPNCGLIGFLQYDDNKESWKVRYGAVKSLVQICRYYRNDATKDGVTNAAWSSLMQRQTTESELRVLEAMKIAKAETELARKFTKDDIPSSLWTTRLASALTQIPQYQVIPAQTHTPHVHPTRSQQRRTETTSRKIQPPGHPEGHKKPTLRQDINLSNACFEPRADYNTRQNLELRAVIEEQWKKKLLEDIENETKTNIEQLDKEREQELESKRTKNQEKIGITNK